MVWPWIGHGEGSSGGSELKLLVLVSVYWKNGFFVRCSSFRLKKFASFFISGCFCYFL